MATSAHYGLSLLLRKLLSISSAFLSHGISLSDPDLNSVNCVDSTTVCVSSHEEREPLKVYSKVGTTTSVELL